MTSAWTAEADPEELMGIVTGDSVAEAPGADSRNVPSSAVDDDRSAASEFVASDVVPGDLRAWTAAIRRGDEPAFTRFHDLYSLRIFRYLLVLSRGDETVARDVLQTIVVKAARRFEVFDEERRLWAWLCRLARNGYIDFWRAQRRAQRFVALDEAPAPELIESSAGEHHLSAALQKALEELSEEERELMRTAYVDRRPLQELADGLGQSYKALESRLGRLRRKVRENLLRRLRHEKSS